MRDQCANHSVTLSPDYCRIGSGKPGKYGLEKLGEEFRGFDSTSLCLLAFQTPLEACTFGSNLSHRILDLSHEEARFCTPQSTPPPQIHETLLNLHSYDLTNEGSC